MRLTMDKQHAVRSVNCSRKLAGDVGEKLVDEILTADQTSEAGLKAQRERIAVLKQKLSRQERHNLPPDC